MRYIQDYNFNNKKVLVRTDFNVPLDSAGNIKDDTRIRAALPTIRKILQDNGSVILMSHLGRPKQGYEKRFSLQNLRGYLSKALHKKIAFSAHCIGANTQKEAAALPPGEVLLLENLRFHAQEKSGDAHFAQALAQLGDVYVNDAFGAIHRFHTSTAMITQHFKTKMAGYLIQNELKNINALLKNPKRPFTAIVGGAKIADKITFIDKLIEKADYVLIGGGMAHTFHKALGGNTGNSLVEANTTDLALALIKKAQAKGVNLLLPIDAVIAEHFNNNTRKAVAKHNAIPAGWMGLDIGPATQKKFSEIIQQSHTILWNGPMGVFEMSHFSYGTQAIAQATVKATEQGAFSLIGGGESAAAVNHLGWHDQVSHMSTGGGALLAYITGQTLPALKALG